MSSILTRLRRNQPDVASSAGKYCVIGAGPAGLTVVKNLRQCGIELDCFEREDDLGGNWHYGKQASSVYASTRLISSKQLTEYTDHPMPQEYPTYPHHTQVLDYLQSYARRFQLGDSICFGTSVQRVEPAGNGWDVTLDDGRPPRHYRGVVIANGHHRSAKLPDCPGTFSGETLHSSDYKTPEVLRDKRVLVVGAGNSGCDIAVEAAQNARQVFHSMRRGYHFLPKFVRGRPIDQWDAMAHRYGAPLWLRRYLARRAAKSVFGNPQQLGLPRPDHRLFETHPIINSQLPYYLAHGAIHIKPAVRELCGQQVLFTDGSRERIDLIVYATGFKLCFPFIQQHHLNWRHGRPSLYLNIFHPQHDHLFVAGMIQPNGGLWGLADLQSQLIGCFLKATLSSPRRADWFRRLKASGHVDLGHGIHYDRSERHLLEVEYFAYRRRLQKLIRKFTK